MESLVGQVVGHYRLTQYLDDVGVAPVYRAEHIHYGKLAAVKVLSARLSDHPSLRERYKKEAETLTRLRHPNIVRVSDFIVEDDILALAMDLIDGESLDQELTRRKALYTATESAPRILPMAAALAQAHAQGAVHGTLTPSKVMLTLKGDTVAPRLLGFGVGPIQLFQRSEGAQPGRSNPCWYLAPEQCRAGGALGPAVDQYALAVMAYQLLTGQVPCDGESDAQILDAHSHHTPASPTHLAPGMPPALASILLRALAKNPEGRWPTVDAFAVALREAIPPVVEVVPPPTHQQSTVGSQRPVAVAPVVAAPVSMAPTAPAPVVAVPVSMAPTAPAPAPVPVASEPDAPTPMASVPSAPSTYRTPRPQTRWGGAAPPAHPTRHRAVTWWILVLAFGVATSAALIAFALMSSDAPEKPNSATSATSDPQPTPRPNAARPQALPTAPDAAVVRVPIPMPSTPPSAPIPRTGSEICDRYLQAYKCYVDRLPVAARAPATAALRKMAEAWRKMIASPGNRDIVESSCTSAYATMGRTIGSQPLAKGCFPARPRPHRIPTTPTPAGPAAANIGVPACDAYLRIYRCFQSKMPASVQSTMSKALDQVQRSWKSTVATPYGKKGLKVACEMALAAFRKTLASNPLGKACVK